MRQHTITEAFRSMKSGKITPSDLVEDAVGRIEEYEPDIKAWATLDFDGARAAAKILTKEARNGHFRSQLHGIPIGIKDIIYTKNLRTMMGSPLYENFIPDTDAAVVSLLRKLGAVIVGKTHTTEFASHDPAPTRNPWNIAHTPGGSSSGSAAAVSAGMVPLALGTQTGGSITRPAAFCGVVGLKPTHGLIDASGVYPLSWSLDHVGFFSANVGDAAIILGALTSSRSPNKLKRPPTIGVPDRFFEEIADQEAVTGYRKAINILQNGGANIITIKLPESFNASHAAQRVIMASEAACVHHECFKTDFARYRPHIRGLVASGHMVTAESYIRAQRIRRIYMSEMAEAMRFVDAVASPSARGPAPMGLESTGDPAFNTPWSLAGFPTITIPTSITSTYLPLGLQLASKPREEGKLLPIASWCESIIGFKEAPPT